jgi:hypothetical protein
VPQRQCSAASTDGRDKATKLFSTECDRHRLTSFGTIWHCPRKVFRASKSVIVSHRRFAVRLTPGNESNGSAKSNNLNAIKKEASKLERMLMLQHVSSHSTFSPPQALFCSFVLTLTEKTSSRDLERKSQECGDILERTTTVAA